MSSLAGQQGSPGIAAYAATKAFGTILAEGLWAELRGTGVDVLACLAGAVSTPNLAAAKPKRAPGTRTPEQVAAAALAALGRGPRVVPGPLMRVSSAVMSRLLPRRTAISVIARASADLTP
jgi:short-subunit dehydrogenase